jgi:hypothetical protein
MLLVFDDLSIQPIKMMSLTISEKFHARSQDLDD